MLTVEAPCETCLTCSAFGKLMFVRESQESQGFDEGEGEQCLDSVKLEVRCWGMTHSVPAIGGALVNVTLWRFRCPHSSEHRGAFKLLSRLLYRLLYGK